MADSGNDPRAPYTTSASYGVRGATLGRLSATGTCGRGWYFAPGSTAGALPECARGLSTYTSLPGLAGPDSSPARANGSVVAMLTASTSLLSKTRRRSCTTSRLLVSVEDSRARSSATLRSGIAEHHHLGAGLALEPFDVSLPLPLTPQKPRRGSYHSRQPCAPPHHRQRAPGAQHEGPSDYSSSFTPLWKDSSIGTLGYRWNCWASIHEPPRHLDGHSDSRCCAW